MTATHQHCPNCLEDGNLLKIPSVTSIFTKSERGSQPHKTGELVKEFIEASKEELRAEKQNLKNQEHK